MPPKGEAKTKPREYVVVKRTGPIECEIRGTFMATSASRAVDQARDGAGGRWVAVPVRNWGEEDLTVVQRDPIVRRQKLHPGQTAIDVPEADEAVAA